MDVWRGVQAPTGVAVVGARFGGPIRSRRLPNLALHHLEQGTAMGRASRKKRDRRAEAVSAPAGQHIGVAITDIDQDECIEITIHGVRHYLHTTTAEELSRMLRGQLDEWSNTARVANQSPADRSPNAAVTETHEPEVPENWPNGHVGVVLTGDEAGEYIEVTVHGVRHNLHPSTARELSSALRGRVAEWYVIAGEKIALPLR